jgi:hypothetical protein
MTGERVHSTEAAPDLQLLAESLHAVAAAIDQARLSGLSVTVPEPLYRACLEIVTRHDGPDGPRGRTSSSGGRRDTGPVLTSRTPEGSGGSRDRTTGGLEVRDVPLRRLVWQVINPGEEFTVADIAARLDEVGASWPTTAVSNALGYWASRDRLTRVRKGTYRYPRAGASISLHDGQQEGPAATTSRAPKARGEEHDHVPNSRARRKAAS